MAAPDRKVLLVDDDELNRLLLEHMVRQLGLNPFAVPDGETAVQACAAQRFALILMDRRLTGINGFEALARIRAAEAAKGLRPVPAILLSGDIDRPGDGIPAAAGFVGALVKPFRLDDLAALVERALAA